MHSFVPSYIFLDRANSNYSTFDAMLFCATGVIKEAKFVLPWPELKKTSDEVHKHVCGHASVSEIKILLKRNNNWTGASSCWDCTKNYEPQKARKVSLSSVSRSFNETICIDHFHLGNLRILHIMDASTRHPAGTSVPGTGMEAEIGVLNSSWISPFWAPTSIHFDQAFDYSEFKKYLLLHNISARTIPARRHNKNVIESNYRVIRDIFRIKSNDDEFSETLAAQQAIRISNDL